MTNHRRDARSRGRILGNFEWPGDQQVVGELRLSGAETLLKVHSEKFLAHIEAGACISGVAYTGKILTLINCQSPGTATTSIKDGPKIYSAEVFPHFVAAGRQRLSPSQPCIRLVQFSSTDLSTLFYDFNAFGQVADARSVIDSVLNERRQSRPVEAGAFPAVCYYTGRDCVVEVPTEIGKISVHHQPSFNFGGPEGVYIKNRMAIAVEVVDPIGFTDAIERVQTVTCFLSMAAGRTQVAEAIHVLTSGSDKGEAAPLSIHASFPPGMRTNADVHKPHPTDVPFDPIQHRSEFEAALTDWIRRHRGWRFARSRYLDCIRKGNRYNADRLVAAANMFDVLPDEAAPPAVEVGADLVSARDASVAAFRKLPVSSDRDSALSALGRIGKPSLPKKIAYRIGVLQPKLGSRFPDLQFVASIEAH